MNSLAMDSKKEWEAMLIGWKFPWTPPILVRASTPSSRRIADTDGILALGAPQGNNIITALREKDVLSKYKIANFDVNRDTLDALAKGEILFSFDAQQYLMGYLPVVMLTLNARYGTLPTKNIYTGPTPVTAADVEKIMVLSKKGIR